MIEYPATERTGQPLDDHTFDVRRTYPLSARFFSAVYRPLLYRVAHRILKGRAMDPRNPTVGRFLRCDVRELLSLTWRHVSSELPYARLDEVPNIGNRHNVYLSVLTVGVYNALRSMDIDRSHAVDLCSDVGWTLYASFLVVPRTWARLLHRNEQKQMNAVLRMLMVFPFSAPGRPGYEVTVTANTRRIRTDWTYCPPLEYIRQYVSRHGDRGELALFRSTWCAYDWAFAYAIASSRKERKGSYFRPHTLSEGDSVCDMCWSVRSHATSERTSAVGNEPTVEV